MFGPFLKGERVTLRPADDSDPPRFIPWVADVEVTRYLGRRTGMALYQEVDFFKKVGESKNDVLWIIDFEDRTVGAIGIHAISWQNALGTTGILIGDKTAWGHGVASEAMQLRTRYAFRELNLRKLRSGRNIAGILRDVPAYAAPTDTVTGMPVVVNGCVPWPHASLMVRSATLIWPGTWCTSSGEVMFWLIAHRAVTTLFTEPGS